MIDGGNGLTSWLQVLVKNKLTMFGAHCPVKPLDQLADSKVLIIIYLRSHCKNDQTKLVQYLPSSKARILI